MQVRIHHDSVVELALAMWSRRKWLGLLLFAAGVSGTVSLVAGLPDLYRAKATVLVEQAQVAESFARSSVTGEIEPRLLAVSQELLSRPSLQSLIDRFDLYSKLRSKASPEAVIERMRRDMNLERKEVKPQWGQSATVGFTLSYQGPDPHTVALVTNTLASFYVEQNQKIRDRQATGTTALLREQLEDVKRKLEVGVRDDDASDGMIEQLAKLRRELTELRTLYSDKYPDVIRVKAEIAVLEQRLATTGSTRARAMNLDAQSPPASKPDEANIGAGSPPQAQTKKSKPSRDYAAMKELHASLLKRYEEAQLAETLERRGAQFRIVDPAVPPRDPVAPARPRLIMMGLILSLVLAGAAMVVADQLDTSFHRVDELYSFANMPILASIPRIVTPGDIWRRMLRVSVMSVLAVVGLALVVRGSYFLGQNGEQLVWILAQRGA